jgi:poly-beta-hydroxyalkanoate depolymerase
LKRTAVESVVLEVFLTWISQVEEVRAVCQRGIGKHTAIELQKCTNNLLLPWSIQLLYTRIDQAISPESSATHQVKGHT